MRKTNLKVTHPEVTAVSLRKQLTQYPHARVGLRIALVQGVLDKVALNTLSQRHRISREAIYQLIRRVNERGLVGIVDGQHTGRRRQLSSKQEEKIKTVVSHSPGEIGYHYARWDGVLVREYIQKEFGITYSVRHSQRILRRLGLTLQRPRREYCQADLTEQECFKQAIKKNLMRH